MSELRKNTGKTLVIVESPSKAKTIEKYLGSNYEVVSSKGHICDLATTGKGGLGIDVDHDFKTTYAISPDKKATVADLKKKSSNAAFTLLATDPDREGEAIAWHLARELNLDLNEDNRIVFHEVTKPAVSQAIQQPHQVDMQMVASQETRRILDRIIGFKLSTLLNSKIKSKSAGRVQSVALKLIVDREDEIAAFKPEEYWTVTAQLLKGRSKFEAELSKIAGKKAKVENGEQAGEIQSYCQNNEFRVADLKEENKKKKAKLPYTTSSLQQDSANKLYFSSKKTMQVAQKLYEGIDIGTGLTGLITYMRSDSIRLSDVFLASASKYIEENYGKQYVGHYHGTAGKNAQDAHEAIRPTSIENNPEKIKQYLSNDEYKLYRLIYYRALACAMKDASYKAVTAKLVNGDYEFTATGRTLVFDGYLKVYGAFENSEDKALPALTIDEQLKAKEVVTKQHFTEPPLRYSEARLIKAMEEYGIGRPSTYATIIDTILKREYVTLEKPADGSKVKVFKPTEQGTLTTKKLDEYFNSIINVKYTANMETQLDEIAEGKMDRLTSLNTFYNEFMPLLDNAKAKMEKLQPVKLGELCPDCGGELVKRKGRFGEFVSCINYPECKYTRNLVEEQPEKLDRNCPECGAPLMMKQGRFGKFIACSNYPGCKYTEKIAKAAPKPTGTNCPQCGSPLVERKSRYGKTFVGCSNYPKCHYIQPSAKGKKNENEEG